ncbi:hypothetical protein [Cumulibacter soli]|uniref:hypothetical protein n=1 Tax=Cumulibacter soli TaxID=2546344 RepID=UPI0010689035|nr:hypothetical protein [Cumulibacter soli]
MDTRDDSLTRARVADLRFVAAHFEALQGLAVIPGLVVITAFFAVSAWAGDRFEGSAAWALGAGIGIALALLMSAVITRWYRRTYGQLAPSGRGGAIRWVAGVAVVAVLVVVAGTVPVTVVSLEGLVVGVAVLVLGWLVRSSLGIVLLPAGVLIVTTAMLPLGHWLGADEHPLSHTEVLLGVVCLVWIVVAVRSHIVLARTLRPQR